MSRFNKYEYGEDYDYEEFQKEKKQYEWEKNKHLYKENIDENEPYDRVDGEGRGVFPEYFPPEAFEELEEFDALHELPEIGQNQEYYERYMSERGKENEALAEERDGLEERYEEMREEYNKRYVIEKEKSSPFIPDVEGKDEILDLNNQIELIEQKQGILWERFSEACQCAALDELKLKERYWAERYERELEQIRKDEVSEKERKREFYERGEEHYSPEDSARSKRFKMSTKIEMANDGLTPDAIGEVVDEYDGLVTSGEGYVRAKENLAENFDKISYEEALEILAQGKKEGKYSDDMYYNMQAQIRRHYKV